MTEQETQVLVEIKTDLAEIKSKVEELWVWKNNVTELLYGNLKGEFGYFHKSNILWRVLILWPLMLSSIAIGAAMTLILQHSFWHK